MTIWVRITLVAVCLVGLFLLGRYGVHGPGVVALGVAGLVIGRLMYTSRMVKNPLGEERDYSVRPVIVAFLKCASFFVAMMLWTIIAALMMPDTSLGVAAILVPALALLALSVRQFIIASTLFKLGGGK